MKWLAWWTPRRLAVAMIGAPLLLTAAYLLFIAADRYVSESVVTVRQATGNGGSAQGLALLLPGINTASREDALYLRQFIHSLALLKRLDERLQLRRHYEAERWDPVFRLYRGTSQEGFLDYYRNRVELQFDDVSSLLTVRAQGFTPAFAQALNAAILEECETFVNAFSQRVAREQMRFAEGELTRAGDRMRGVQSELLSFQSRNAQLDPMAQAEAATRIEGELQAQVTRLETELRTLRAYLNDDAYPVRAAAQQLEALKHQLDSEQRRVTAAGGAGSERRVNRQVLQFQDLKLQNVLAQDAYKIALVSVESARLDASRKLKSLAVVEPPSHPETALYPRRLYDLATLLVVCVLLYGIARLGLAVVREHQD
jgi:capsular polysaccharide transport system permease protein